MTSISHDLCVGNHMILSAISHIRYINILTWLSGQTSIFGVVFFVSKSPLGIGHVRYINILKWLRGFLRVKLSIFGVVFFVFESLLRIERQKKL